MGRGQNTMDSGYDISLVGGHNTMYTRLKIPWVTRFNIPYTGGSQLHAEGVKIPWVACSIYDG